MCRNYFSSAPNALLTLVLAAIAAWILWHVVDWAFVSAVWGPGDPALCKAPGAGACWMVIVDRWRLILFGLYPAAEQWRSAIGCAILVLMAILTCVPRFWNTRAIVSLWLLGFGGFYILMRGGMLGLVPVLPQHWGGLALTLFVFASVVVLGMPLAIVLALLRRSAPPAIARATGMLIDAIRSLPLLSLLYTAAVIVPLALPDWLDTDKLYRVVTAFALFFACYQAEVLRGGFQSLPKGQDEAGMALGMNFRHRMAKILLPQVFKLSLPPTINQFVITFKETSLIVIIGFFEILASGSAAFGNAKWSFAYIEVYVFIGAIYFAFVFSLSRYGALLERRMSYGG